MNKLSMSIDRNFERYIGFEHSGGKAIAAATVLGTMGALTILVMPGLLGVIVNAFGLDDQQIGLLASVEIFTMAIATGAVTPAISRFNWRVLGGIGLAILAIGNLVSIVATDFHGILWARGIAGVGEGIAVAVSFSALGVTRDPDRSFGIYLVFGLVFSAIVLAVLPLIVHIGEHALVFGLLAALCAVSALLLPWQSPQSPEREEHSHDQHVPIPYLPVALGLAMVTLFFIAQGAVWSYLERMGAVRNIDPQSIGNALSLSALAGVAGAGIAMLVGSNIRRSIPITISIAVQVASMLWLARPFSEWGFFAAVMMFNFGWNLCQPYFSGIMSEMDPEGRVVVLMGSLQTIGVAAGPFIAAATIGHRQYQSICYLGIGSVLGSLLMFYVLLRLWRRAHNVLAPSFVTGA